MALILPSFRLTGLDLGHATENLNGRSAHDCGALWQRFMELLRNNPIPDRIDGDIYAVYHRYASDHNGPFSFFIGCRTSAEAEPSSPWASLWVPEQHYRHILAKGPIPACIADAWKAIWKDERPRAYGFDWERYGEKSQDWAQGEVDIFLSVPNGTS